MNKAFSILLIFLLTINTGCGVYSFTGANISSDVKTISIQTFFNDTDGGPPNMGQLFTDELRDYFQQNTSLILVPEQGDIQFEGTIIGYRLSPSAPTAGVTALETDQSSLTRLTITIKTSYVNTQDERQDFERNFSFFEDFNTTQFTINDVEDQLIEVIFNQIIIDMFNASVANW